MGVAMAQPYSADLRERVLLACEHREGSREVIAHRFRVSVSTVYNWLQQARTEGRRQAKPHAGGPAPTLDGHPREVLRTLVAEDNDATLAEYVQRLAERTGCQVSDTTLCIPPSVMCSTRWACFEKKDSPGHRADTRRDRGRAARLSPDDRRYRGQSSCLS